ncbi:hypothetical protein [Priestia megaterium]|nr:hypothetical protein [Priestia megaterium]
MVKGVGEGSGIRGRNMRVWGVGNKGGVGKGVGKVSGNGR